jgi:hypothetical protein
MFTKDLFSRRIEGEMILAVGSVFAISATACAQTDTGVRGGRIRSMVFGRC